MKTLVAAVFIAFASLSAAHAVEVPRGAASDPRVKFVDYEEAQVYRIVGTFRTATQIVLSEDETIQHVALGDTVSWEVAVAGHILFLKPRERAGPTNLIVTTSRGGTLRSYRSEEHTSELQSLMRISYAVFCLKKKRNILNPYNTTS